MERLLNCKYCDVRPKLAMSRDGLIMSARNAGEQQKVMCRLVIPPIAWAKVFQWLDTVGMFGTKGRKNNGFFQKHSTLC